MRKMLAFAVAILTVPMVGQSAPKAEADAFACLHFLDGTWEAKASGDGVQALGTYTFAPELRGHVYGRHSTSAAGCTGPKSFDCEHGDLLYVYPEGSGLKAIYFDNEGHVIHYDVTTPTPTSAMFLSDGSQPGPRFRLVYELKAGVMTGRFQMQMPGQTDWRSYLEWSGAKKSM